MIKEISPDDLIDLPPKWKVKYDNCVGFSYYNQDKVLELQHPKDDNNIRMFCWAIYNKMGK